MKLKLVTHTVTTVHKNGMVVKTETKQLTQIARLLSPSPYIRDSYIQKGLPFFVFD